MPCNEIVYRENRDFVEAEAAAFVDTLSEEQLIALASGDPGKAQGGNLGSAGISVPGSAGETNNCAADKNLASIVLADGPAGLRLMKHYNVEDGKILSKPFSFSLEGGIFCPDLDIREPIPLILQIAQCSVHTGHLQPKVLGRIPALFLKLDGPSRHKFL